MGTAQAEDEVRVQTGNGIEEIDIDLHGDSGNIQPFACAPQGPKWGFVHPGEAFESQV